MKGMNPYYYWFFFVYNIYYKLTKDRDFPVYATAIFTTFMTGLILTVSYCISKILKIQNVLFSLPFIFFGGIIIMVYLLNSYLFLHKGKHHQLFSKYLETQTIGKDIVSFIMSVGALFLVFYIGIFIK